MKRIFFLLFFFVFCSFLHAGRIPKDNEVDVLSDFSGGLNTAIAPHKMDRKYSPKMINALIDDTPGTITETNGYMTVGSTITLGKINFQFKINYEDGTVDYVVSDSSIVLATADFLTYRMIRSNLSPNVKLQGVQVKNKGWFTDGVDSVFTVTKSTVVLLDGTSGNPNVPRGKYISYFGGRVFLFNSTTNPSGLYFSEVSSTDTIPIAINPDSQNAWPLTNLLQIGQGDGSIGTAIWIYKGILHIGKEASIFQLFGTGVTSFTAKKTDVKIGPFSQDSIVVQDGFTYFYSQFGNGVYEFNGTDSRRLTDLIKPDMDTVKAALVRILEKKYDTKPDFDNGSYSATTMSLSGIVSISTLQPINYYTPGQGTCSVAFNNKLELVLTDLTTSSAFTYFPNSMINPLDLYTGFLDTITFCGNKRFPVNSDFSVTPTLYMDVRNENTGEIKTKQFSVLFNTGDDITVNVKGLKVSVSDILQSKVSYKIYMDTLATSTDQWVNGGSDHVGFFTFSSLSVVGRGLILLENTTGQYISNISTVTPITYWDIFSAGLNSNGGNINFFVRAATSSLNISTETWNPIYSGSLINIPASKNYIQFAATFTTTNILNNPALDYVSIKYNQGGASDSAPFSFSWKNNFYIVVTTETNSVRSVIYKKAKITHSSPDAWMLLQGLNIKSFVIGDSDSIYGGSSSTGTIYRIEYGTNFDGAAIPFYYETPDMFFGSNYFEKTLHEYVLDYERNSNATLSIGTSLNGGAFSNRMISIDGSGRSLKSLYNIDKYGKFFRFNFQNNEIDKRIKIHGFGAIYEPLPVR